MFCYAPKLQLSKIAKQCFNISPHKDKMMNLGTLLIYCAVVTCELKLKMQLIFQICLLLNHDTVNYLFWTEKLDKIFQSRKHVLRFSLFNFIFHLYTIFWFQTWKINAYRHISQYPIERICIDCIKGKILLNRFDLHDTYFLQKN